MAEAFYMALAGRVIKIRPLYRYIEKQCRNYIIAPQKADIIIEISPEDIAREKETVTFENGICSAREDYLESLAVYRKIAVSMIPYNVLLFHGSAIAVDGREGYLFIAPSGTGKSTHTALWRQLLGDRTVMINDDKPLLYCGRDQVTVCGTPWDGKHHLSSNQEVPLKAICILERHTTNRIVEISRQEALPNLLQQCYQPEDHAFALRTLQLLEIITDRVKLYRLGCNMELSAAEIAYRGMKEGEL